MWCGDEGPDRPLRLTTHALGWHTLVLLAFGVLVHRHPPVHHECIWPLRRDRWARAGAQVGGLLIGWALWDPASQAMGLDDPARWMILLWLVAWLVPGTLLASYRAPPFDFTAYKNTVVHEFRDGTYAQAFGRLNRDGRPPEQEEEG